ncbi:hypothetical protein PHMEG_00038951, partial [Phytophthora megakarya]
YYQHADRQTLPFNFIQTCHSMWHLAQLKHRQEDREIYEGLENTIALKFRVSNRRMAETVSLLQRVVVRRFQENNWVVVVWKVFTEGEGLFRGMHSDETGLCVARPSSSSAATGTILDTCFRHVPMHFSSSSSCTPVVNEFTDMYPHNLLNQLLTSPFSDIATKARWSVPVTSILFYLMKRWSISSSLRYLWHFHSKMQVSLVKLTKMKNNFQKQIKTLLNALKTLRRKNSDD